MKTLSVIFAMAIGLASGASYAATVQNGGLTGSFVGSFDTLGSGNSTSITGWTVGGAGVDHINTYWQSADGDGYSVDMSALGPGSLSQVISGLTFGSSYVISFFMSGNPAGGNPTRQMNVDVGGPASLFTYTMGGNGLTAMNWQQYLFGFVATGTSQTLTFTSLENNAYGPALDAISISEVPVPAGGLLLLTGLGGIFAMRRRRG